MTAAQLDLFAPASAPTIAVLTFEQFAAANGASRQGLGDAGLHISNSAVSRSTHLRLVALQAQKDHDLMVKRGDLAKVYQAKLDAGEIRAPSAREEAIAKANGHPDNDAVQAARRICERRGWYWQAA